MIKGNRSAIFLQTDEIDHLTIRYTDFGENLNRSKAAGMIHFYSSVYDEVGSALSGVDVSYGSLEKMSEEELYEILVKIRTVLLDTALNM